MMNSTLPYGNKARPHTLGRIYTCEIPPACGQAEVTVINQNNIS